MSKLMEKKISTFNAQNVCVSRLMSHELAQVLDPVLLLLFITHFILSSYKQNHFIPSFGEKLGFYPGSSKPLDKTF